MAFNLISVLTELDRKRIENYVHEYGASDHFVGIDEWLKDWGKNKIKMYKLLGNNLRFVSPFEVDKTEEILRIELDDIISGFMDSPFDENERDSFYGMIINWAYRNEECFTDVYEKQMDIRSFIRSCVNIDNLIKDKTSVPLTLKLKDERKTLQLPEGMKPIRALSRFLNYCKNIPDADLIINVFNKVRERHSIIMTDKKVRCNLVFSIHPLDFITMSDNDSNWQSCMNWKEGGCYRIGTVEMMNSNNVLCCYLENSTPFYFMRNHSKEEEYTWNNKRWRQLIYFTKDIIVGGKSYPYRNEDWNVIIIKKMRELAAKNLHWTYSFGPELYQDMKHISTAYAMQKAKEFIHYKDTKKHNIIFDSKGMYNDMFNDHNTKYWCVRNKVNHNKVICYSGKARCLCCNTDMINEDNYNESWGDDDYNDRYVDTENVVCKDCRNEYFTCEVCFNTAITNDASGRSQIYTVENAAGEMMHICKYCFDHYVKICPDCGKPFYASILRGSRSPFTKHFSDYTMRDDEPIPEEYIHRAAYLLTEEMSDEDIEKNARNMRWMNFWSRSNTLDYYDVMNIWNLKPMLLCNDCLAHSSMFIPKKVMSGPAWARSKDIIYVTKNPIKLIETRDNYEKKYSPYYLQAAEYTPNMKIYS